MSKQITEITIEEIEKYNIRVPRYTSYPTVPHWDKETYTPEKHISNVEEINVKQDPLSIYIHLPFCRSRCLFCGCNVIITQREERTVRYLRYLKKEISTHAELFSDRRDVVQVHLGGGTPTHLTPAQLDELFNHLFDLYKVETNAELSIEVHPSVTSTDHIDTLRDYDFNRLSMGVQDFDPYVQEKLNRYQTLEETVELINYARDSGFESINMDLIYGLPYQTEEGFEDTLEKTLSIQPERLAVYSYAHFPQIFRHHKGIPLDVIPQGSNKLELFLKARETFLMDNYEQIGFDHFTLKEDDLWKSYQQKSLRRNFMGYTTKTGTDMIAFGWSGISEFSNAYGQNTKDMPEYEKLIAKYGIATVKGHQMSDEDVIRKDVIMKLMCQGEFNLDTLQKKYNDELSFIREEMDESSAGFKELDLLRTSNGSWQLTEKGMVFARIVASTFDAYYDQQHLFSTTI